MLSALLAIDLLTAFIAIPYMLGEGSVYWNDLKFIRIVGVFVGVVLFAMKILLFVLVFNKYNSHYPNEKKYLIQFDYFTSEGKHSKQNSEV